MKDNLKDILSSLSTEVDQETLLLYLQGKLSEEKKHEVEKKIMNNEFADDAMEGLQQFKNKYDLSVLVEQLNRDLHNKLEKKKKRREKLQIKDLSWIYFAVIIIILLIVISYYVIHKYLQHQ
jgi:NAD+--asparagine ADP-ribosyltransferase